MIYFFLNILILLIVISSFYSFFIKLKLKKNNNINLIILILLLIIFLLTIWMNAYIFDYEFKLKFIIDTYMLALFVSILSISIDIEFLNSSIDKNQDDFNSFKRKNYLKFVFLMFMLLSVSFLRDLYLISFSFSIVLLLKIYIYRKTIFLWNAEKT